jgi:hypothetical protein
LLQRWLHEAAPGTEGSLLEFAGSCDDAALRDAIYELDAQGYRAEGPAEWSGERLAERLSTWRGSRGAQSRGQGAGLTDLYARSR